MKTVSTLAELSHAVSAHGFVVLVSSFTTCVAAWSKPGLISVVWKGAGAVCGEMCHIPFLPADNPLLYECQSYGVLWLMLCFLFATVRACGGSPSLFYLQHEIKCYNGAYP